jgi:hypothetical protein
MNSRGNEIWLGGDVDRGLLFLSTKEIWIWVGRMRDPLSLRCSLMEEREDKMLWLGTGQLTPSEKKGCIYSPWGENDCLGQIWDFRLNSRLDRKSNRKLSMGIQVENENQTRDFQFEPDLGPRINWASPKTCLGLAELVWSNVRLKPEIPGWISG